MEIQRSLSNGKSAGGELTQQDIKHLQQAGVIPPETPLPQVMVFAKICRERNLSPFSREIYLVPHRDWRTGQVNYTPIVGIDGYRKKAATTGELAGCDAPRYNVKGDGTYQTAFELQEDGKLPRTCQVTAYRMKNGQKLPFTAECVFKEFAAMTKDKQTGKMVLANKWAKMPFQMIAKCAEAFALRKGFNDQLSGLHIAEELPAFENNTSIADYDAMEEKDELLQTIKSQLEQIARVEDLKKYFQQNPQWQNDHDIITLFSERKREMNHAK